MVVLRGMMKMVSGVIHVLKAYPALEVLMVLNKSILASPILMDILQVVTKVVKVNGLGLLYGSDLTLVTEPCGETNGRTIPTTN